MRTIKVDGLILSIIGAILAAALLPVPAGADVPAHLAIKVAIFFLFFLYGARLPSRDAFTALKNWRLHTLTLGFTFLFFPVLGMSLRLLEPVLGNQLYSGILFLTLVPSTVQSSVNFISIARGDVAGGIIAASLSNLVGVLATPAWVAIMIGIGWISGGGLSVTGSSVLNIMTLLLLPFVLGQLLRLLIGDAVGRKAASLSLYDRGVIVFIVYVTFSAAVRNNLWETVSLGKFLLVTGLSIVIVAFMLWLTRTTALHAGLPDNEAIAVQFCATKKSLATGLPMATILFSGQAIGVLALPLMIFHPTQLLMCSVLAARYSRTRSPVYPSEGLQ